MASRSLQASSRGVESIVRQLTDKGWTQEKLSQEHGCSLATAKKFCRGVGVSRQNFVELCQKLDLNWEEIVGVASQPIAQDTINPSVELVQMLRDRIRPHLQERCGKMRVLDMSQPIGLDDIYTSVNILEKITGRRQLKLSELLRNVSPEEVERFSLGAVKEERVPGLEAVEKYSKLMILGKPGAGKTTFLKHLAIQCIGGKFQPHRVPIFITLKEFAESKERPDLLEYICLYPESKELEAIRELLDHGNALMLLDGLDEVRETDVSHVLRQIQQLSERYHRNQFVVTCRIAAREYTFEQFTEVEVADFDDDQIADFSGKWFRNREDEVKADRFLQQLKAHPPIRDLATSPLLLTLLCLVFEDSGDFPANRSELYQNGVDVLLKKWDIKRNIERDQVYKKLSLKRKEDLLSQIAYQTFEAGNYFFKQKDVERQIQEFIENLPGASTDEQELELDSEAVLKSIEGQHGLFVERASGIYSFSHLTFHEYFAARCIKEKCNPSSTSDSVLIELAKYVVDKRWREVILLTIETLQKSDILLNLMKEQVDKLVAKDQEIQRVLDHINQKAKLNVKTYKPTAIRAFHLTKILSQPIDPDLDLVSVITDTFNSELTRSISHIVSYTHGYIDGRTMPDGSFPLYNIDSDFSHPFLEDHELECKLQLLTEELLATLQNDQKDFMKWQQATIELLSKQMRVMLNEHHNDNYKWQLTNEQRTLLQVYYRANGVLINCLDLPDTYISRKVRNEIENTLLLPIAEIQKRQNA